VFFPLKFDLLISSSTLFALPHTENSGHGGSGGASAAAAEVMPNSSGLFSLIGPTRRPVEGASRPSDARGTKQRHFGIYPIKMAGIGDSEV
jgi:hypothetical protein